jgi:hypothetical protein
MIKVDTVYQRVLTLANKEQRGYITPQEFNLIAGQAQMEIFEQYFYDRKSEDKNVKNSTEFSNVDEMLEEKIAVFLKTATVPISGSVGNLPADLYRLGQVEKNGIEVEQLNANEVLYRLQSPISAPTIKFPAFIRKNNTQITTFPAITNVKCNYIRAPKDPYWAYVVVLQDALYNAPESVDFDLHKGDEAELVYKILSLAGIVIAKPGLGTFADGQINTQKTQEKQ